MKKLIATLIVAGLTLTAHAQKTLVVDNGGVIQGPIGLSTFASANNLLITSGSLSLASFSSITGTIPPANGGTGVDNTGKTITLGGNLTTSGAYSLALTATANTNVTLPASGTLLTTTGSAAGLTSFPTLNQSTTGNSATATKLATARNIASHPFDGTANISIASTDLSDGASLLNTGNINSTVQAYDPDLTTYAGITPGTIGQGLLAAGSAVLARNAIGAATGIWPVSMGGTGTSTPGLVAGPNIILSGSWPNQTVSAAASGNVSATSNFGTDNLLLRSDGTSKNVQPTGIVVDDSNNISNIGTTTTSNFSILDSVDQSNGLSFIVASDLTANKTFTYTGAYNFGMTLAGDTNVTYPTSGTLATTSQLTQSNIVGLTTASAPTFAGLTLTEGTVTTDTPINITQTWNASLAFNAFILNVTDTASLTASKLMDLQVGGVSKFSVAKNGTVIAKGNFSESGSMTTGVTAKTANYTVTSSDHYVLMNSTGGARTITLPSSVGLAGIEYILKDYAGTAATNNITITTTSSQTIDGATTKVLNTAYGVLRVVSDGTNWATY